MNKKGLVILEITNAFDQKYLAALPVADTVPYACKVLAVAAHDSFSVVGTAWHPVEVVKQFAEGMSGYTALVEKPVTCDVKLKIQAPWLGETIVRVLETLDHIPAKEEMDEVFKKYENPIMTMFFEADNPNV